ncbi:septum formation family protein, partial [Nocardia salmonicida]|uniref:septum formation family protein n=1 Tax=Nocardia salmonicida TaxID=53431 RepID=UPI0033DF343A
MIVLLGVFAVLLVATVAVAAVLLVRNGDGEKSGGARSGDVASPSAGGEETDSEEPEPDDLVSTLDLDEGDCFQLPAEEELIEGVEGVDCAEPHEAEVYAERDIEAKSFPGDEAADVLATDFCEKRFETFVGLTYADSVLDFYYFYPSTKTWTRCPLTFTWLSKRPRNSTTPWRSRRPRSP